MANVLPPENKKDILRAQRARFLFAFASVALVCALLAFVALTPSFIALVLGDVRTEQKSDADTVINYASQMRETKKIITELSSVISATSTPTEILRIIVGEKPQGVAIDTINFTSGDPGKIVIGGHAARTELIQTYRNALASDTHFVSASVPVSALVGSKSGDFSMTIAGSF